MASIFKKGKMIYISWYDPVVGKKFSKSSGLVYNQANLKKANGYAKQLQKKLEQEKERLKSQHIQRVTIKYAFQHFLKNNSGKDHKTIKDYNRFYNKFIETFDENDLCTIINKLAVEDWLNEIKQLDFAKNTIYGYYKQLNHFLNFLFEYSYIPMFKINRDVKPKPEVKEKIVFKEEDVIKIFSNLKEKNSNFRTLVNLLFYTGLRSSDLLNITVDRINLEEREIAYYSPKRKKYKLVGFHKDLVPILKSRLQEIDSGEIVKYKNVENLGRAVTRYFDDLLMRQEYTARTFRKNFITMCRKNGIDSSIVAELVGHEHNSTADKYYNRITTEQMKEALQKIKNPAASKK